MKTNIMDLSITQVPYWLSALFIISFFFVPVILIANAARSAYSSEPSLGSKLRRRIILFFWCYLTLVAAVSLTGFFEENAFPPRIIIFAVIPLFLFYLIFVQQAKWFKELFERITLSKLIYIHVFRFVGVFFFLVYAYDALPAQFAFIGGGGDILTAVLAFPVIYALKKKQKFARTFVWIWNVIGLLDIISVISTAIILTQSAIENGDAGVQQFGTFPFSWIPAFAPATIVFLHILIFRKLLARKNESKEEISG